MHEAMHPLTLMAAGLYGKSLSGQSSDAVYGRMVIAPSGSDSARFSFARVDGPVAGDVAALNAGGLFSFAFLRMCTFSCVNAAVYRVGCGSALRRAGGTPLDNARFFCLVTDAPAGIHFNSLYAESIAPQLAVLASTHLPRCRACVPAPAVASAI
jgi:hypothetical protein